MKMSERNTHEEFVRTCTSISDAETSHERNAELAEIWPEISLVKDAMIDHEKWDKVENKLALLER